MKKWIREKWDTHYCIVIPIIISIIYIIYCLSVKNGIIKGKLIQDSIYLKELLSAVITFMSIILSVWGMIIPLFVSAAEKSEAIKVFIKNADMSIFVKSLKTVFGVGMKTIFFTCVIFLKDILGKGLINVVIVIWMWFLLRFLCGSYRFIRIIISLLCSKKTKIETDRVVAKERQEQINEGLPKL